jgi:hypothetical protein
MKRFEIGDYLNRDSRQRPGARLFLIGALLFAGDLISVGLDWPLAVLYTGVVFMLLLGRVVRETGAFVVQP